MGVRAAWCCGIFFPRIMADWIGEEDLTWSVKDLHWTSTAPCESLLRVVEINSQLVVFHQEAKACEDRMAYALRRANGEKFEGDAAMLKVRRGSAGILVEARGEALLLGPLPMTPTLAALTVDGESTDIWGSPVAAADYGSIFDAVRFGDGAAECRVPEFTLHDAVRDAVRALNKSARHPGCVLVNLGANDGRTDDPLFGALTSRNCSGLYVDKEVMPELRTLAASFPGVEVVEAFVTPAWALSALAGREVDVLKVDIDSWDCHVLAAVLPRMRVQMVVLEVNPIFPPPLEFARLWVDAETAGQAGHPLFSCSLSHAVRLLAGFGFFLKHFDGQDALFLQRALLPAEGYPVDEVRCFARGPVRFLPGDWEPFQPDFVREWLYAGPRAALMRARRNSSLVPVPREEYILHAYEI